MRRPALTAGLAVLVVGIILLAYGSYYASSLGALIEAGEWNVTWYSIEDSYGRWGKIIGSSSFPKNFNYKPLEYKGLREHFGFKATLHINLQQDATIIFRVGSDDGAILFVDGDVVINSWFLRAYTVDEYRLFLTVGQHELTLWYYQWEPAGAGEEGPAISFEMYVEGWELTATIQLVGAAICIVGGLIIVAGFFILRKE